MTLRALLWDVDGTLAETERDGHRMAFNAAFQASGLPWHWSVQRYGELLTVTGGRERLLVDMDTHHDAPPSADARAALAAELHQRKNALYKDLVESGGIALRPGVRALLDEAAACGLRQGITTTTSRVNVAALLQQQLGADWRERFELVVCGDDVAAKKPDPEVYVQALAALGLDAHDTLAIEDAPAGVAACITAGVPVIVTRSIYFPAAAPPDVVAQGPGLHSRRGWQPAAGQGDGPVTVSDLRAWHARVSYDRVHAR